MRSSISVSAQNPASKGKDCRPNSVTKSETSGLPLPPNMLCSVTFIAMSGPTAVHSVRVAKYAMLKTILCLCKT
jgi:hypothetical protein